MKIQNSKLKVKSCGIFLLAIFALFTIHYSLFTDTVTASDKWQGVDESVIEKGCKGAWQRGKGAVH